MSINTTEIESVYTALSGLAEGTLDNFIQKFSMTELTKSQVLSSAITALIQTSANQVQQQPLIDAQIAQATAQTNAIISEQSIKEKQSTKDIEVKSAQIAQATAQTNAIISEQSIKEKQSTKDIEVKSAQIAQATAQTNAIISKKLIDETQSAKDIEVKDAQKGLILKEQATEDKKIILTDRQTTYYNDQLRIEESKHLSTLVMGFGQAGTTLPDGLLATTLNAAAAITP